MSRNNTPIELSRPLIAIDLGCSGVRAIAAEMVGQDKLHILGYEESNSKPGYKEKGIITHTSDAGYMISEVLRKLANRIGESKLPTAFVCLNTRPMQVLTLRKDNESEQECLERIEAAHPQVGVLSIVNRSVFLTKRENNNQLLKAYDQSTKTIEASFIQADALLSVFAACDGDDTIEAGAAVLDFGAETTTLTLYQNGEYIDTKTVALGSDHITQLITQQGIAPHLSEKLKCQYGYAAPEQVQKNYRMHVNSTIEPGEELTVTSVELSELIEIKLNEILTPLIEVLQNNASRVRTLYITGGGAMLQGFDQYMQSRVPMRVVYGAHNTLLDEEPDEVLASPKYSALVGTLLLAADYRAQHKYAPRRPNGLMERVKKKITQTTLDIFTDMNE